LNSLPDSPKNWGHVNPNLDDYYSHPMEISSTFWIADVTYWWHLPEETHSQYANPSNVACDIVSNIPHGIRFEAHFSYVQGIIGWRHSKTTEENLHKKVIVRLLARARNRILAGNHSALD